MSGAVRDHTTPAVTGAGANVVISEADPPADLPAGTVYYKVADSTADPLQVLDTWVVPSA